MKKMFKKMGLSAIAMLGLLAMAPHQANAAVRFGVVVGRPAYPVLAYPVCRPVVVARPFIRHDYRWDRHDYRFRR
jgi:hypothetical protein